MHEIKIIPVQNIIEINQLFSGHQCDAVRAEKVKSCYSAFYYYPDLRQQIASIVLSLLKGHFFIDANKRTSLFVYLALSELNNLNFIKDALAQADIFVNAAATHIDAQRFSEKIFPCHV